MTDGGDAGRETCTVCGDPVGKNDWHPIAVDVEDEGETRLYAFCSPECRAAWNRE